MLLKETSIEKNIIHIWKLEIPDSEERYNYYLNLLSYDEIARSERFHFQKDRNEYVCCRGFLRETLSGYLSLEPEEILFDYGKHGKPEIANNNGIDKIKFNLSHSKGHAMIAVTLNDEIGVDIELIKEIPDMMDIAKELYTSKENKLLLESDQQAAESFFKIWTRKEAVIKAVGHGLSAPLKMIDVSGDGDISVDKSYEYESEEFINCRIKDLTPPSGYSAAVALCGKIKEVSYFTV
ncbi:MAG: 4'-phosphopantetheinyl transferase superfamily protein [Ignavibacteriales bacterium]|nr:MAG: 4'-phosphopantetheinyl transferase superfamily protein [Ignavibacteriales bacterium]